MESSQPTIDWSKIDVLALDQYSLPDDYFQLRINSNNIYSRGLHPKNNCYNFTIEFEQPAAESIQFRINQCNQYQVISARLPIRNTLGIPQLSKSRMSLASPIVKSFSPVVSDSVSFKSKLGMLSESTYNSTHEDLHSIHFLIECDSFSEDQDNLIQIYAKKKPPMMSGHHWSKPQATLLYNKLIHSANIALYKNMPYLTYPPDLTNMSTVLLAYPRIMKANCQHLSLFTVQIYPNESDRTYDIHQFDQPKGLETDLTLVFYRTI